MIFVDTNVFMHAVGGPHPLREPAREFLLGVFEEDRGLVTSAEVMQELLHARERLEKAIDFIENLHLAEVLDQEVELL